MKSHPVRKRLVAVLVTICSIPIMAAVGQDMRPSSAALAARIASSNRKTVAVVDFTDLQGNVTELGRFLAEELSVALVGDAKGFDVIDRTSIRVILQEHKLTSQGLIDPATARKLGQIAGVDTLVTGTLTPLGDSVHVTLKVLDTETAKMVGGFTVEIPRTKAVDELLGRGIAGASQLPPDRGGEPNPGSSATVQSAKFQLGDFYFSIEGCRKGSGADLADQLICSGRITNRGTQREELAISSESYVVDNLGHQTGVNWLSIGGGRGDHCCAAATMDPDLPLQFWFDARGFSDEVTSVTVIFLANGHRTILHDIKLQGR